MSKAVVEGIQLSLDLAYGLKKLTKLNRTERRYLRRAERFAALMAIWREER